MRIKKKIKEKYCDATDRVLTNYIFVSYMYYIEESKSYVQNY